MERRSNRDEVEAAVEATLTHTFPDVELVDFTLRGGADAAVTVYIDRPAGVDLELCTAVTKALDDLRSRYSVEVSSPGLDRPLRQPRHFRTATGSRVFVKTARPLAGRSVYRGALEAAGERSIRLRLDEEAEVEIPYDAIAKAHVIFEFDDNGGHRE